MPRQRNYEYKRTEPGTCSVCKSPLKMFFGSYMFYLPHEVDESVAARTPDEDLCCTARCSEVKQLVKLAAIGL